MCLFSGFFTTFRAFWFPGFPAGRDFGVQPFYVTNGVQNGNGICPRSHSKWMANLGQKPKVPGSRAVSHSLTFTLWNHAHLQNLQSHGTFTQTAPLFKTFTWLLGERTNWAELIRATMTCPPLNSQPWVFFALFCFVFPYHLELSVPMRFVLPDSSVSS